jgi:glycine oxidase
MSRSPDIIVIGAGIVGCAIAYELARRGASVTVIEERSAGAGATRASAGMLAPYVEADADTELLSLTVRSLGLFDDFIGRLNSDSGSHVPYRRTGTLQVASDVERMRTLTLVDGELRARAVDVELLDAHNVRALEPHLGKGVVGGLLVPAHGYVDAVALTQAMAIAARRFGAHLVEGGAARRIAASGTELTVETERGSLTAHAVVLAAGSWSARIEIVGARDRLPVRPVRGQLLRLAWNGPPIRRVTWGNRCYLVPWDDGTLLVGATVEEAGFDERTTVAGVRDLLEASCELVPHAWTAGFIDARAGFRPASADDLPIVGRSRVLPNLMYATGHYRSGVLLAPLTARLVGDAILEDIVDPAMEALGPERFGAV